MRGWQMVAVIAVVTVVLLVVGIRALLRGRRVPAKAKLVIAGAILWLLSPLDPIPDVAMPIGMLDDLAVLIAAVRYVLDHVQPPEPDEPHADRRAIDRRLDRHDVIEPTKWRYTDDRDRPGPS